MGSIALLLALSVTALVPTRVTAEPLGHGLTRTEREYIRTHRAEYLRSKQTGTRADAPQDILGGAAEFSQLEGVSFAYTQFPDLVTALAKEASENVKAYVAVKSDAQEQDARARLNAAGANMNNVVFDRVAVDSIWMRDYGPNICYTKNGSRVVVDLGYNRPRPQDDAYPKGFAVARKLPVYSPALILPGGNLILDGHGVAIMTNMVFDADEGCDPNLTTEGLQTYFKDYFGCKKVILLKAMKNDGTGHADMFCKLLNDTTFIVGQYENPADGSEDNAATLDDNAAKLAKETNGNGQPFRVIRMPMPAFHDGVSATYTNSLLVNDKVFVPQYKLPLDAKALEIYRTALPGAKVVGFDCTQIIGLNGAIHCITHEVNSDPLDIVHTNPMTAAPDKPLVLTATVKSDAPVAAVKIHWRSACSSFVVDPMIADAAHPGVYTANLGSLPVSTTVQYWIEALDDRGMRETFPAAADDTNSETIFVERSKSAGLPGLTQLLGL